MTVDVGEGFAWFAQKGDAASLRFQVLGTMMTQPSPTSVVLLQRRGTRRIHTSHPFNEVYMEGLSFLEQARSFATATIVIAAHGAAMTWSAFIKPCTVVVQLYPTHYYPIRFYEALIVESGGVALSWWDGAYIGSNRTLLNESKLNADQDFAAHHSKRGMWRSKPINIDNATIDTLLQVARTEQILCYRNTSSDFMPRPSGERM